MRAPFVAGAAFVLSLAACGQPGESPGPDEFVPGRDLSLAELAERRAAPDLVQVNAPEPSPGAYGEIERAVEEGRLERSAADEILLSLLFGEEGGVPEEYRAEGLSRRVPDSEVLEIVDRMAGYPEAVRLQLQEQIDRVRSELEADAGGAGPLLVALAPFGLAPPAPVCEQVLDGQIRVCYAADLASPAALVKQAAIESWPRILAFFGASAAGDPVGPGGCVLVGDTVQFTDPATGTPLEGTATSDGCRQNSESVQVATGSGDHEVSLDDSSLRVVGQVTITVSNNFGAFGEDIGGWCASTRQVYVRGNMSSCSTTSTTAHELFHAAHKRSRGAGVSAPAWVREGGAVWSEEWLYPALNNEWLKHECYARSDAPEYCGASGSSTALADLAHAAGMFVVYLAQAPGLGGTNAVRSVMGSGGSLEQLPGFPASWLDFVESSTGYDALFDAGIHRLTDQMVFPYATSTGCGSYVEQAPYAVGQEIHARQTFLEPDSALELEIDVPPVAARHEIIHLPIDPAIQWYDLAFTGQLGELLTSSPDRTRAKAVVVYDGGERVENLGEMWTARESESVDLMTEASGMSEGSFRFCVQSLGACADAPRLYPGLTELRLVIANARTGAGEELEGDLLVFPGGAAGFYGRYHRVGKPEQ